MDVTSRAILFRYAGLRISDVATFARDCMREDRIFLYTMKHGRRPFRGRYQLLSCSCQSLPIPKGTEENSTYSFGAATAQSAASSQSDSNREPGVEISNVWSGSCERFLHIVSNCAAGNGGTTEDVSNRPRPR